MMTDNDSPETEYDDPGIDPADDESESPALPETFAFTGTGEGFTLDDPLDIDAALAAVGSLSDLLAEQEAHESAERQRVEREIEVQEERARRRAGYVFPHPPAVRLQRGSPASVIPALLLMGIGGYLTFALTLSDTPPAPSLILLLVGGSAGIVFLSHGLASGRWSRGSIFAGLALLLISAALYVLTLQVAILPNQGLLLVTGAVGLAVLLTGILAKPASGGLVALGLAVIVGCSALFVFGGNLSLMDLIRRSALVVLPVLLLLMLMGMIFRRRGISTTQSA